MSIEKGSLAKADSLPFRLHHNGYVCADQELTRHFYEDILGFPLLATWIEEEVLDEETVSFSHTFYGLADGSALAFFNFADPKHQARFSAKKQEIFVHVALSVTQAGQRILTQRLEAAAVPFREIDHGYCFSVYVVDPDGLTVEFTCDPPNIAEIMKQQSASAHSALERWTRGDRTPNNDVRHE